MPVAMPEIQPEHQSDRLGFSIFLAVAIHDPEFRDCHTVGDLPSHRLNMLRRFFQDYKVLEGKQVEVDEFQTSSATASVIEDSLERYSNQRRRGFHQTTD